MKVAINVSILNVEDLLTEFLASWLANCLTAAPPHPQIGESGFFDLPQGCVGW